MQTQLDEEDNDSSQYDRLATEDNEVRESMAGPTNMEYMRAD